MSTFQYHADILARFPNVVGGVILARGMTNSPTPDSLLRTYYAEQQTVKQRIGDTPLSQVEALSAWRSAFRAFNMDPTQYRSAAEALLRRLAKHGDIPSVNTLVDIGNLVSIRYAMPVAVIDWAGIAGAITVRFAIGTEHFTDLGSSGSVAPEPGEVIFTDEDNAVAARRWCWRQSAQSATSASTAEALIVTEAQHETAEADVASAVADLTAL